MARATLGVIVGNRDFFPDALVTEARADVLALFEEMDIEAVILDADATKLGGVETWREAQVCAQLFDQNRKRIEGVLVVLPNFGDEKGVADTMRLSGLDVPILLQAYPTTSPPSRWTAGAMPSAARSPSPATCASTASGTR